MSHRRHQRGSTLGGDADQHFRPSANHHRVGNEHFESVSTADRNTSQAPSVYRPAAYSVSIGSSSERVHDLAPPFPVGSQFANQLGMHTSTAYHGLEGPESRSSGSSNHASKPIPNGQAPTASTTQRSLFGSTVFAFAPQDTLAQGLDQQAQSESSVLANAHESPRTSLEDPYVLDSLSLGLPGQFSKQQHLQQLPRQYAGHGTFETISPFAGRNPASQQPRALAERQHSSTLGVHSFEGPASASVGSSDVLAGASSLSQDMRPSAEVIISDTSDALGNAALPSKIGFAPTRTIADLTCNGQKVIVQLLPKVTRGLLAGGDATDIFIYRRNYFAVAASYDLRYENGEPVRGTVTLTHPETGHVSQVKAICLQLSATVDDPDGKSVEIVGYSPQRDKGDKIKIEDQLVKLRPRDIDATSDSSLRLELPFQELLRDDATEDDIEHPSSRQSPQVRASAAEVNFERLQFKRATLNNGKRTSNQQHFLLKFTLSADLRENLAHSLSWTKFASCHSDGLVVRGRSPNHYSDRRQGVVAHSPQAQDWRNASSSSAVRQQGNLPFIGTNVNGVYEWDDAMEGARALPASLPEAQGGTLTGGVPGDGINPGPGTNQVTAPGANYSYYPIGLQEPPPALSDTEPEDVCFWPSHTSDANLIMGDSSGALLAPNAAFSSSAGWYRQANPHSGMSWTDLQPNDGFAAYMPAVAESESNNVATLDHSFGWNAQLTQDLEWSEGLQQSVNDESDYFGPGP